MAITSEIMGEIFTATQNDMQAMTAAAKETFFRPEIDRETVKMWESLPLVLREAITERNPSLAKRMDKKAEQFRTGEVTYEHLG